MNDLTDFNDLAATEGPEAVAEIVNHAVPAIDPPAWPEPLLPGVLRTPDIPCSILPGVWGQMAQAVSDRTQTPAAMAVMTVLGVLATLIHGRYEVDTGTHREILAFWSMVISGVGSRKSAVMDEVQGPVFRWEKLERDRRRREIVRNDAIRSTAAKRIEGLNQKAAKATPEELQSLRDEIEREELEMPEKIIAPELCTDDVTPETMQRLLSEHYGRMSVISDEPGLLRILGGLYSKGGASLDVFLKGHVGSALKVARAAHSIYVKRPCVTLILMIQPDMVAELAGSNQFRSSGLMARFFYAMPVSNVGSRDVRKRYRIPDALLDSYDAAVMALLDGYPPEAGESLKPQILVFDELAEDLWLDFSQEIENQLSDGGPLDAVRDWASKLPGGVARVAALIEIATAGLGAQVVGLESMHQAIKLARLMVPHTQAAFSLLGADSVDADVVHILKWIRNQRMTEFSQRQALKAMESRFKKVENLKKALDKLKAMDCIRQIQTLQTKGRPSIWFGINPGVLS